MSKINAIRKEEETQIENPKDAFIRLASKRTKNALKRLRLVGNLSSKARYDYTQEELDKIFAAIDEGVAAMKSKFAASKEERAEDLFKL